MNPREIAEIICEKRNPLRIKANPQEFRYNDNKFKDRSKMDCKLADKADAKELEEVYAL